MHDVTPANEAKRSLVRSYRFEEADVGEHDAGFFVSVVINDARSFLLIKLTSCLSTLTGDLDKDRRKLKYQKRKKQLSRSIHHDRYFPSVEEFTRLYEDELGAVVPIGVLHPEAVSQAQPAAILKQAGSSTRQGKQILMPLPYQIKSQHVIPSGINMNGKRPSYHTSKEDGVITSFDNINQDMQSTDFDNKRMKTRIRSRNNDSKALISTPRSPSEKDMSTLKSKYILGEVEVDVSFFTKQAALGVLETKFASKLNQQINVAGIFGLRYTSAKTRFGYPNVVVRTFEMLSLQETSACVDLVWNDQEKYGNLAIYPGLHSEQSHLYVSIEDKGQQNTLKIKELSVNRLSKVAFSFQAEVLSENKNVTKSSNIVAFNLSTSIISLTTKQFKTVKTIFSSWGAPITLEPSGDTEVSCDLKLPDLMVSVQSLNTFKLTPNMYIRRGERNCFIQIRKNTDAEYSEFGIGVAKFLQPSFCYKTNEMATIAFAKNIFEAF